jgi:hypothetical protein
MLHLKNVIAKLNYKLNLGSYADFAFANSNASTHTNYLIELLKNDLILGSNRSSSAGRMYCTLEKLRFDPCFNRTHNYTGERGLMTSPRAPVSILVGVHRGTPCPQRAGHYSGQAHPVNTFFAISWSDLNSPSAKRFNRPPGSAKVAVYLPGKHDVKGIGL